MMNKSREPSVIVHNNAFSMLLGKEDSRGEGNSGSST